MPAGMLSKLALYVGPTVSHFAVNDRIAIRDVFDDVGSKYVPPHVNIFYCFGGLEERFCVWPSLGWYTDRLLHVSHVSGPIAGCMFTDGIELTPQLMPIAWRLAIDSLRYLEPHDVSALKGAIPMCP